MKPSIKLVFIRFKKLFFQSYANSPNRKRYPTHRGQNVWVGGLIRKYIQEDKQVSPTPFSLGQSQK